MNTENIIALSSLRLKAEICFEVDKGKPLLRPCDSELYPAVKIETFQDLNGYQSGDTIDVDVVKMESSNGQSYFYNY